MNGHRVLEATIGSLDVVGVYCPNQVPKVEFRPDESLPFVRGNLVGERAMIAGAMAGTATAHGLLGEGSLGSESDLFAANELARALLRSGCDPRHLVLSPDGPRFGGSAFDAAAVAAVDGILRAERTRAAELSAVLAACLGEGVAEEDAA